MLVWDLFYLTLPYLKVRNFLQNCFVKTKSQKTCLLNKTKWHFTYYMKACISFTTLEKIGSLLTSEDLQNDSLKTEFTI